MITYDQNSSKDNSDNKNAQRSNVFAFPDEAILTKSGGRERRASKSRR